VKFARAPAAPQVCREGMQYARNLLERTRPPSDERGGRP